MRLVSLCPSLTELLFDLGVGADVIGRTRFCVHPVGSVDAVERVGGTKNPRIARIIELSPDVVFMNEEENRLEDATALRAAGIEVHSSLPRTAEETAVMVRSIGTRVGRPDDGERIAADIEARATQARARAAGRLVRYAYVIWREPWMTINDDTFVAGLLDLAGGVNVFGDASQRYPTIELSQLAEARPTVVLLSTEPFPFADRHRVEVAEASGIPEAQVQIVDGELLSWHGSRTPAGIDYASTIMGSAAATVTAGRAGGSGLSMDRATASRPGGV